MLLCVYDRSRMIDTSDLFQNDVPVLRTSLVRHGLVDLSVSPPTCRSRNEVRKPFECSVCLLGFTTVDL